MPVTLTAINELLEIEFKQFKEGMCKAFETLEQRVGTRQSSIGQKIDVLESGPKDIVQKVDKMKSQVVELETRSNKHDTAFRKVEQDYKYLEIETGKLNRIIDDLDNTQRINT